MPESSNKKIGLRQSLSTVVPYLSRYRRAIFLGMGALALKDILGAAMPLVIRSGVDSLTHGFQASIVYKLAGLLIGVVRKTS